MQEKNCRNFISVENIVTNSLYQCREYVVLEKNTSATHLRGFPPPSPQTSALWFFQGVTSGAELTFENFQYGGKQAAKGDAEQYICDILLPCAPSKSVTTSTGQEISVGSLRVTSYYFYVAGVWFLTKESLLWVSFHVCIRIISRIWVS